MKPLSLQNAGLFCLVGLCFTWSKPGRAEDDAKRRCVRAYEDAQTSKRQGKLIDAKEKLLFCSSPQCPEVMHRDCQRWHDEVEDAIPSVVFRVQTPDGSSVTLAKASIDGAEAIALDGRAVSLDPGRHTITYSAKGFAPQSKTLDVSEGEKLRREIVVLAPVRVGTEAATNTMLDGPTSPKPETEPPTQSHLTVPIVIAASAAVLGGVGATYFGLKARSGEDELSACSPNCTQERVDGVKRDYLFANTSLGLAAAGLIATTVLFVFEFRTPDRVQSARLGVRTDPHQLSLSLGGNF